MLPRIVQIIFPAGFLSQNSQEDVRYIRFSRPRAGILVRKFYGHLKMAVWRSSNALVSINEVALR